MTTTTKTPISLQTLMTHPQAVNTVQIIILPESDYLTEGYEPPIGCVYADLLFTTSLGEHQALFSKIANVEYDFRNERMINFSLLNELSDYAVMFGIEGYIDNSPHDLSKIDLLADDTIVLKQWIVGCNMQAKNFTLETYRQLPRTIMGDYSSFVL